MKYGFILPVLFSVILAGCPDSPAPKGTENGASTVEAPAEFAEGERFFNSHCAGCHGSGAKGTDRGPTFISKIYEPSHHGDSSFHLAVRNGVRAHHWRFGNMPKIRGINPEEVDQVISYIRWIQRENGIS
ncbi:MAG: c-type cytochrome [Nitrospiria bacterium]